MKFSDIDLYNCKFGKWYFENNNLHIYMLKGFSAPKEVLDNIKPSISYILDPWLKKEYDSWELTESGLKVHIKGDREDNFFIAYAKEQEIKELLKYHYYGGAWLVFKGVTNSVREVSEYTKNLDQFTGREWSENDPLNCKDKKHKNEFLLEGVFLEVPAWIKWSIKADNVDLAG